MRKITESDMEFGLFPEETLFQIENSKLHRSFSEGIKTVEFILLRNKDNLIFLEAKKTCPNAANKEESDEKNGNFRNTTQIYRTNLLIHCR